MADKHSSQTMEFVLLTREEVNDMRDVLTRAERWLEEGRRLSLDIRMQRLRLEQKLLLKSRRQPGPK